MAVAATFAILAMGFSTAFATSYVSTTSTSSDRTGTICHDGIRRVHCTQDTVTSTTTVTTAVTVLQADLVEITLGNATVLYCQFPAQTVDNDTWVNSFPKDVRTGMTSASEAWSSCDVKVTHIPGTP